MAKPSPLSVLKERFGSKSGLIDKLVDVLESDRDESKEEHKRRLRNVANSKLLHLMDLAERVEAAGGRDGLVKTVLELKGQARDHEFADKLKSLSLGRLLDMAATLKRKSKA